MAVVGEFYGLIVPAFGISELLHLGHHVSGNFAAVEQVKDT